MTKSSLTVPPFGSCQSVTYCTLVPRRVFQTNSAWYRNIPILRRLSYGNNSYYMTFRQQYFGGNVGNKGIKSQLVRWSKTRDSLWSKGQKSKSTRRSRGCRDFRVVRGVLGILSMFQCLRLVSFSKPYWRYWVWPVASRCSQDRDQGSFSRGWCQRKTEIVTLTSDLNWVNNRSVPGWNYL